MTQKEKLVRLSLTLGVYGECGLDPASRVRGDAGGLAEILVRELFGIAERSGDYGRAVVALLFEIA